MSPGSLFGIRSVGSIAAVTLLYVVVAELTCFDLIVVRQAGFHQVAHRAQEIMFVWTLSCLVYGWALVFLGRMRYRRPDPGPVAWVPAIIGSCLAVYKLWAFDRWPFGTNVGPAEGELRWILLGIASSFWIAGLGAVMAYTLVVHGRIWRGYRSGDCHGVRRREQSSRSGKP